MAFQTQYPDWLTLEAQAGRSGAILDREAITRGMAWKFELAVAANVSGDAFKGWLRTAPDSGTSFATTVTVGAYEATIPEHTVVTFALSKATVATLPTDNDGNGLEELLMDILRTPSGGDQYRMASFSIPVSGKVTDGD